MSPCSQQIRIASSETLSSTPLAAELVVVVAVVVLAALVVLVVVSPVLCMMY
jgi:hypothetical protein